MNVLDFGTKTTRAVLPGNKNGYIQQRVANERCCNVNL